MSLHIGADGREWVRGRQTGIGRYLENIVRRALKLKPDWRWTIFMGARSEQRVQNESVSYVSLPGGPTPLVDQVGLPRMLRRASPDLFFSPYIKCPWSAPGPVVCTVHDLIQLRLPPSEGGLKGPGRAWFRYYARRSLASATAVVSVSRASADDAATLLEADESTITVIHNQVGALFTPGRDSVAGETGAAGDSAADGELPDPYFLAVSNFRPHKNIEALFRTWTLLHELEPVPALALVGHGDRRESLARLAESLGVSDHVIWLGPKDDAELLDLYRGAAALLQPSYLEGFGLPVAEAMACGTPAIVSDRGSLPEVQGDAGPILDPDDHQGWADAVNELVMDSEVRARAARHSLEQVERFRPEQTTDRILELLERSAQESGRPRTSP